MDRAVLHANNLWVIVSLQSKLFAFSAMRVQIMIPIPEVFTIPQVPKFVRGVINLRGKVMPLVDMRLRLGMVSYKEELNEFCTTREQDHKNWLLELENSVKEQRSFKLTTDPHKCAFGKWYDSFHTTDIILAQLLKEFDTPHKKIHAIAEKVIALSQSGDNAGAMKIIDDCRNNELAAIIRLFGELRRNYAERNREISVILDTKRGPFAITVDSIDSVGTFVEGSIEEIKGVLSYEKGLADMVGRVNKGNKIVFIVDENEILGGEAEILLKRSRELATAG